VGLAVESSAQTAADGKFLLSEVPTGLGALRAASGGKTLDARLTVLNEAEVQVGDPPVSRLQAIDAAKAEAAKTFDLAVTDVLAMQQPVPAGAQLAPASRVLVEGVEAGYAINVATPKWLVFVDGAPQARWSHDALYVLVDCATGELDAVPASSWPEVNGCGYYGNSQRNETSQDLVQAAPRRCAVPASLRAPETRITRAGPRGLTADQLGDCARPRTHALLVRGCNQIRTIPASDLDTMQTILLRAPFPALGTVVRLEAYGKADPRASIVAAWHDLAGQADYCDTLVFFLTSHGETVTVGGVTAWCGSLWAWDTDLDARKQRCHRLFASDLDLTGTKACHIVFVVDTCYSGQLIEDLRARADALKGKEMTIITACRKDEASISLTFLRNGVETYYSAMLYHMEIVTRTQPPAPGMPYDQLAANYAATVESMLQQDTTHQVPQMLSREVAPEESCGCGTSTGTIQ
jgi:hypothetical protein